MENYDRKELLSQALLWDMLGKSVGCGMPILDSLEAIASAFPKYEQKMLDLRDAIASGNSFAGYFEQNGSEPFHPLVPPFIAVGESTGALDVVLDKVSYFLEREAEFGQSDASSALVKKLQFYNFMAIGIDAGLPLVNCLELVYNYSTFPPKEVTAQVYQDISGKPVTEGTYTHTINDRITKQIEERFQSNPLLEEEIAQSMKEVEKCGGMQLEDVWKHLDKVVGAIPAKEVIREMPPMAPEQNEPRERSVGSTFAGALAKHPQYFDSWDVAMINCGETGGILDTVLNRMLVYYEKKLRLEKE